MKKSLILSSLSCCCFFFSFTVTAQNEWPRTLMAPDGAILTLYQPQPDSFRNNILQYRSAFSLLEKGKTEPEFGMFQAIATVETDRDDRLVTLLSVKIPILKLPDNPDAARINQLKATLEAGIPGLDLAIPLDELLTALDMNTGEKKLSLGLNNQAPRIIFATQPSILVIIDGEPRTGMNKDLGMEVVVNTPYTILRRGKGWYL
ncbi:MAG TPA: hypothetical protein VKU83_09915, partial [Puia sp.]|nr:hypothetical protein [Puia sp.]